MYTVTQIDSRATTTEMSLLFAVIFIIVLSVVICSRTMKPRGIKTLYGLQGQQGDHNTRMWERDETKNVVRVQTKKIPQKYVVSLKNSLSNRSGWTQAAIVIESEQLPDKMCHYASWCLLVVCGLR